jgi:hypothetical protein
MAAAAEERAQAWEKRARRNGSGKDKDRDGKSKSGEGLDKFQAGAQCEATKAHVAQIKAFEQAQAQSLGYNPYESQTMGRSAAMARIELSAPAPPVSGGIGGIGGGGGNVLGGSGSGPLKDFAYSALLARYSSVTDTSIPLVVFGWIKLGLF